MKENTGYTPRQWQADANEKIDKCLKSGVRELMAVNACVGSGKTDLAGYAFGKFIAENRDGKTIQMFVSPRIKLCAQQTDSVRNFIERQFSLREGTDWKIIRVDCTSDDFNRRNVELANDHSVFVICDESLWGTDKSGDDPDARWRGWMSRMSRWADEGRLFGVIFYDEAHNYENKQVRMFGKEFHK